MNSHALPEFSQSTPFPRAHGSAATVLGSLLCLLTLVMHFTVPQSAWHNELLPLEAKLGILSVELVATLAFSFFASIPLAIYVRRSGVRSGTSPWLGAPFFVIYGLLIFAHVTSWAVFRSTGRFLDGVVLRIWNANPVQVVQHTAHMEAGTLILVPLLVGILTVAAVTIPRLRVLRRPAAAHLPAVGAGASVLLVGAVLVGARFTSDQIFIVEARERSGPIAHALWEAHRGLTTSDDPLHEVDSPAVARQPLISMREYFQAVDPEDVRTYNVIVLLIESLRADQLLTSGGEREVMPNVERLAREGLTFRNHYTQASHSDYADLAPLSSHYPLRSPSYHIYPRDPSYPRVLIYDVLKQLGYRTAIFSSQNEHWGGMLNYLDTGNWDRILHAETYQGPTYVPRVETEALYRFFRGQKRAGKIDDRFTVGEAIQWIGNESSQPFFIYMNLQNSHLPYEVPADFPPRFGTGTVTFPIRLGSFPPDSTDAVKDLYANALAYVDAQLGRLIGFLEERGLLDRTIIVITGDTGQAFFEHGFAGHASELYNEVMRVPLVIHGPGIGTETDDRLSEHVDVPPTLLSLLGLPPHPSFQGRNLLGDDSTEREVFLVGQAAAHQYAIVREHYKLIYDATANGYLLFDLAEDPGETRDLSADRPRLREELAARLHAWRKVQLDYYADVGAQRRWYPPTLTDDSP